MMKLIIYFRVYDMNGKYIVSFAYGQMQQKHIASTFKKENFNNSPS